MGWGRSCDLGKQVPRSPIRKISQLLLPIVWFALVRSLMEHLLSTNKFPFLLLLQEAFTKNALAVYCSHPSEGTVRDSSMVVRTNAGDAGKRQIPGGGGHTPGLPAIHAAQPQPAEPQQELVQLKRHVLRDAALQHLPLHRRPLPAQDLARPVLLGGCRPPAGTEL